MKVEDKPIIAEAYNIPSIPSSKIETVDSLIRNYFKGISDFFCYSTESKKIVWHFSQQEIAFERGSCPYLIHALAKIIHPNNLQLSEVQVKYTKFSSSLIEQLTSKNTLKLDDAIHLDFKPEWFPLAQSLIQRTIPEQHFFESFMNDLKERPEFTPTALIQVLNQQSSREPFWSYNEGLSFKLLDNLKSLKQSAVFADRQTALNHHAYISPFNNYTDEDLEQSVQLFHKYAEQIEEYLKSNHSDLEIEKYALALLENASENRGSYLKAWMGMNRISHFSPSFPVLSKMNEYFDKTALSLNRIVLIILHNYSKFEDQSMGSDLKLYVSSTSEGAKNILKTLKTNLERIHTIANEKTQFSKTESQIIKTMCIRMPGIESEIRGIQSRLYEIISFQSLLHYFSFKSPKGLAKRICESFVELSELLKVLALKPDLSPRIREVAFAIVFQYCERLHILDLLRDYSLKYPIAKEETTPQIQQFLSILTSGNPNSKFAALNDLQISQIENISLPGFEQEYIQSVFNIATEVSQIHEIQSENFYPYAYDRFSQKIEALIAQNKTEEALTAAWFFDIQKTIIRSLLTNGNPSETCFPMITHLIWHALVHNKHEPLQRVFKHSSLNKRYLEQIRFELFCKSKGDSVHIKALEDFLNSPQKPSPISAHVQSEYKKISHFDILCHFTKEQLLKGHHLREMFANTLESEAASSAEEIFLRKGLFQLDEKIQLLSIESLINYMIAQVLNDPTLTLSFSKLFVDYVKEEFHADLIHHWAENVVAYTGCNPSEVSAPDDRDVVQFKSSLNKFLNLCSINHLLYSLPSDFKVLSLEAAPVEAKKKNPIVKNEQLKFTKTEGKILKLLAKRLPDLKEHCKYIYNKLRSISESLHSNSPDIDSFNAAQNFLDLSNQLIELSIKPDISPRAMHLLFAVIFNYSERLSLLKTLRKIISSEFERYDLKNDPTFIFDKFIYILATESTNPEFAALASLQDHPLTIYYVKNIYMHAITVSEVLRMPLGVDRDFAIAQIRQLIQNLISTNQSETALTVAWFFDLHQTLGSKYQGDHSFPMINYLILDALRFKKTDLLHQILKGHFMGAQKQLQNIDFENFYKLNNPNSDDFSTALNKLSISFSTKADSTIPPEVQAEFDSLSSDLDHYDELEDFIQSQLFKGHDLRDQLILLLDKRSASSAFELFHRVDLFGSSSPVGGFEGLLKQLVVQLINEEMGDFSLANIFVSYVKENYTIDLKDVYIKLLENEGIVESIQNENFLIWDKTDYYSKKLDTFFDLSTIQPSLYSLSSKFKPQPTTVRNATRVMAQKIEPSNSTPQIPRNNPPEVYVGIIDTYLSKGEIRAAEAKLAEWKSQITEELYSILKAMVEAEIMRPFEAMD